MKLLPDHDLERSSTVANCRMNRERSLRGPNGYARELGLEPATFLREHLAQFGEASWLDLCCGTGQALIEAAADLQVDGCQERLVIVGVDLVGMFAPAADGNQKCLRLIEASVTSWQPQRQFDLITCVHGVHYIGDKLGVLARAASWLTGAGLFVANLDLSNVRIANATTNRKVATALRTIGLEYDVRKKLVSCQGHRRLEIPWTYRGADDQAGPNYTGQPAVNSHYDARQ